MTEEEHNEMMRSNWKAQMAAFGYGPDGLALPQKKTSGWISVKDRLPEKYEDVIIYGKYIGSSGAEYPVMLITDISEFVLSGYVPIAWMPRPEPPKEADNE